ncbi:RNA polymerase sigma-70 factor [uncultured Bacteroides sp.]|uniref:RNA polymerase sigma-70 factor n=1 Tax=uncultured Bacteroides sp. TaxID=162156 RepID=UPI0025FB800E|nr:RNA polymerase sigma-70 factor [uncultured Bacteroides sp.]
MDERTFRRFIESYSNDLLYYVRCFTRSKEEAEEIVSDVFFEVWQNRNQLEEIRNIKAWLLTITHNKTISFLRKKDSSNVSITWDEVGEYAIPYELQTPDEELISQEEMSRINNIIDNLPPRCKQVFILGKIEKLPYKEIANLLDISVKTINIHIAKALELISEGLKK